MITAIKEKYKRITKAQNKLDYLLKTLSCNLCRNIMTEKIYFCKISKGKHNFCADCLIQGNICPICPENGRCCRNLGLEQLYLRTINESINEVTNSGIVWCKYRSNGCEQFRESPLEDHERICLHQVTRCTFCNWTGTYKEIHTHCAEIHKDITEENGDLFENNTTLQLYLVKGQVFVFVRKYRTSDSMGYSVHHVTPSGRTNCQYELRIINRNKAELEVDTFEGNCKASSMEELRNENYVITTLEANLYSYIWGKRKRKGTPAARIITATVIVFPVSG